MEAIKGLIGLLLAAAVVFAAVVFYNSRTEPAYEAQIIQANQAGTAEVMKWAAIEKTSKTPGAAAHKKTNNSKL